MLDPTPLPAGQSYGSVADIRDCADLPSMPVTPGVWLADGSFSPLWTKADGTPVTIRVRAPSFTERREINQEAADNDDTFVLETCARCIAEPVFTRDQLKDVLATKHPAALDQISETAWALTTYTAAHVEREIRVLAGLTPAPAKPTKRRAKP